MQTERINIPSHLAARLSAERELLLPRIVAMLQDAARNARSRELKLAFVKALARTWRARPDLTPKVQTGETNVTVKGIRRDLLVCP